MVRRVVSSWGNVIRQSQEVLPVTDRTADWPALPTGQSALPHGNGRSYGDSCLNPGGALLVTRALDRFIGFDPALGVLTCEAGVLLADITELALPHGWFLPVTPGTAFVSVGGAIANDVHGKNHHGAGTFGRHVQRFELLRSSGARLQCSREGNPGLFAATIGGLGLTGLITWAEIQLKPVAGPLMDVETLRFGDLTEFAGLSAESDRSFEYTVAWIDCLARGRQLGRGVLQRANHSPEPAPRSVRSARRFGVPFTPPISCINAVSLRVFNYAYYHLHPLRSQANQHFAPFFYPLDSVQNWNRLYGPRGFYQYQCVVPGSDAARATAKLLVTIAASGMGSFLAVLKHFGPLESLGMLSFPQEGLTLALDFPNRGATLERLFVELDAIVTDAGGRLYAAKDGRMSARLFQSGYPRWQEFSRHIDPACSSGFWRRVMEQL
jgi:FAD/FMN-containing dehydrogenase